MLGTKMAARALYKPDDCISEKRDPCSSPPCKRLKQAALPFQCITLDDDTESSSTPLTNQKSTSKPNNLPNQENAVAKQPPANNNQNEEQCVQTKDINITLMETESSSEDQTNDKTKADPPLPIMSVLPETKSGTDNTNCVGTTSGSPLNSTKKGSIPSPKVTKESGTLLRFLQPVTPGGKSTVEHFKTPSKVGGGETPSNDGDVVGSPCTPVNTKEYSDGPGMVRNGETPSPAGAASSDAKTPTPRRHTPGRKLSVEEKLKREEEKIRKQKEKEALEQERLEKKKEKERLKEEKQKERQQREKERIEKKEQEEREKKERLEKKEEEKRKKDEERKKKEDEKNLITEEKRKKEEEQMLKKQKVKTSFASFFVKKELTVIPKAKEQVPKEAKFRPFELKAFMKLASTPYRKPLSEDDRQRLSNHLVEQTTTSLRQVKDELLVVGELAREIKLKQKESKTCFAPEKNEDDIMIIDGDLTTTEMTTTEASTENKMNKVKGKLLQFHENYRPAYFGSWRKKSSFVGPRTPIKKDVDLLNYDVDSDEEWEEEEPGESLSNSEGEDEDEPEGCPNDDDEEQDGFFVPHGYLSDDEGDGQEEAMDQDDGGNGGNEKFSQHNSDDKMQRHLAKQETWEAEMKRQFKPMRPVAIGCIWDGEVPSILRQLEACCLVAEGSIDLTHVAKKEQQVPVAPKNTQSPINMNVTHSNAPMSVPEEAMPFLIKMLHGSTAGLQNLMQLFRKRWTLEAKKDDASVSAENWQSHCTVSKRQVEKKITTIAIKEQRSIPKSRWYVHSSVLVLYKMENITIPVDNMLPVNSKEKSPSPVPLQSKCISPTIASFAKAKDNSVMHDGAIAPKTTSENREDGTSSMDTTPPGETKAVIL